MSVGDDGNPRIAATDMKSVIHMNAVMAARVAFAQRRLKLFTIQEAIRSNGDLRLLLPERKNTAVKSPAPTMWSHYKIEAELNYTIRLLGKEHWPIYADIIRKSFATVAQDFGWTKVNVPGHVSFRNDDQLASKQKIAITLRIVRR